MIPSLITSHHIKEPRYSALPLTPSERIDFAMESIIKPSSPIQSEPPWITYHRSLNWRIDRIQGWTGDGRFTLLLQKQLRGYRSLDRPVNPQPAMTASVLRKVYSLVLSAFDKALCELFIGAFFFAMRSCEYVQVQGTRRTKLLTLRNIKFLRGR